MRPRELCLAGAAVHKRCDGAAVLEVTQRSDQMLRVIAALGGRLDLNQGVPMTFDPLPNLLLGFAVEIAREALARQNCAARLVWPLS